MKKKSSVTPQDTGADREMIHFRPGPELGRLVSQLADQFMLSRGEACKRMTSLAIRGFDLEFYAIADDLTPLLYGSGSFDEACHHLQVAVLESVGLSNEKVPELTTIPREQKLDAARNYLAQRRMLSGIEEEVKEQRIQIRLTRD